MIQVSVENIFGAKFKSTFKTESDANAWILKCKDTGIWGKLAGWYNESLLTQTERDSALETRTELNGHLLVEKQYRIADQFSVTSQAVSASEIAKQEFVQKKFRDMQFGRTLVNELQWMNSTKLSQGQLTLAQVFEMKTRLKDIQGYALDGDIAIVKAMIDALVVDALVTSEMKGYFQSMVNNYIQGG